MANLLNGARAVVTGSTSGLGWAMAAALAAAGARVGVTSRSRERAEATARELGREVTAFALDVRDEQSVAAFAAEVRERFGGVDMLVNNAGIGMRTVNPRFLVYDQPFWQVTPGGFRDVLETKATGVFLVTRAIVPMMLEAGSGRIVNISMNKETMVRRGFAPYGPSGAAVEALSQVMAADLAETPVRVNLLLPGWGTATGMIPEEVPPEFRARLLDPAIMGRPIVWLASKEAAQAHNERIAANEFDSWLAHYSSANGDQ